MRGNFFIKKIREIVTVKPNMVVDTFDFARKIVREKFACFLAPKNNTMEIFFADKTIKLWKVSERDKKAEGYNLKEDSGLLRDPSTINTLRVSESSF